MGFRVVLKTETGEELRSLRRYHDQLVPWSKRGELPMLAHIDPHGDTILNVLQMQSLTAELEHVRGDGSNSEEKREFIERLIEVCIEGARRPHRYLWFIGD